MKRDRQSASDSDINYFALGLIYLLGLIVIILQIRSIF